MQKPRIDLLNSEFFAAFIKPALDVHSASERVLYPRTRDIWPFNTNSQIENGYKDLYFGRGKREHHKIIGLTKLSANDYSRVRTNLDKKLGDKSHYWLFVRYPNDALLDFVAIDVDRHHDVGETPEQCQQIEDSFFQQCQEFEALGIPALKISTPGNVVNGILYQGANYLISFDAPRFVFELRQLKEQLRKALGWESLETSIDNAADKPTRNYRYPGQLYCQIAEIDTDHQTFRQLTNSFDDFLKVWNQRTKISWELATEILEGLNEPVTTEPAAQVTAAEPSRERKMAESSSGCDSNAFYRMVGTRGQHNSIISRHIRKYTSKADALTHRDTIISECRNEFIAKSIPHGYIDHVRNPDRLRRLTERCVDRFIRTYDPAQGIGWRIAKDKQDAQTFAATKNLGIERILRQMGKNFSFREKQIYAQFYTLACKWNGRVAATCIYGVRGICSTIDWWHLRSKLYKFGVLRIKERYSKEQHLCNLYCATDQLVLDCDERDRNVASFREWEKKKETVDVLFSHTTLDPDESGRDRPRNTTVEVAELNKNLDLCLSC